MSWIGRKRSGFAATETLAVIGVIVILAAVMTPSVLKRIREAKISETHAEVLAIATALASFYEDMGRWPTDADADHGTTDQEVALLWTEHGATPWDADAEGVWSRMQPRDTFENQLILNAPGGDSRHAYATVGRDRWDGPYAQGFSSDPWGRKYLCNVGGFHRAEGGPVWVLSAGPDGTLQTPPTAIGVSGDDIGYLLRR